MFFSKSGFGRYLELLNLRNLRKRNMHLYRSARHRPFCARDAVQTFVLYMYTMKRKCADELRCR